MRKLTACLLVLACCFKYSYSQSAEEARAKMESLNTRWVGGRLQDKAYLDSVKSWRWTQLSSGILFDAATLIDYLKNYREVAWSSDKFLKQRISYFDFLATNARMQTRSGEALYFYGKLEAELERQTGNKSLYRLGEQCNYYIYPKQYAKVVAAYEKGNGYEILKTYPAKIRTNTLDTATAYRYLYVIAPVTLAYANLNDTANFDKTMKIAKSIGQELVKKISPHSAWVFNINLETANMEALRSLYLEGNAAAAVSIFHKQFDLLISDTILSKDWKHIPEQQTLENLLNTYLVTRQYDSAASYIEILEQYATQSSETQMTIFLAKSEIAADKGDYKTALELEKKANDIKEDFNFTLLEETQEILYAHAEAEYNRSELVLAEQDKRTRLNWIIGIGALAIAIVVLAYLFSRKQKKAFKSILKNLNEITDIQIAEVEREAAKNEQQRLGQNLHDDVAASLAALKHQVSLITAEVNDETIGTRLSKIADNAEHIYKIVRAKSHHLYEARDVVEDNTFEQQIKRIADSALPDGSYKKEIDVEAAATATLGAAQRIELLRIVQEAVSNIVKHAKKATEVFVFVYKTDNELALEIGDNGSGINKSAEGIGLKSIQNRIKNLGGRLDISSENGVVLKMKIPVGD